MRWLSFLLPCIVIVLLGFALRGLPAVEPARAASLPSEKAPLPAVGPTQVNPPAARAAAPAAEASRPAVTTTPSGKGPVLANCRVELIQEVQVPGIEAGVLMSLEATEGMDVRAGMTLGHVDDREPKMQRKIGQFKHDAAKAQAESDIDIRFARAACDAAEFEYKKDQQAIDKVPGAISGVDIMKVKLAFIKAKAGVEKAIVDHRQLEFEADTKGAEVEAADLSIERRQIRAPFDGVVTNVYRHPGEWVAPGDPVIKVIQVDRLRIEGSLSAAEYDPPEIDGRPVTIEAELAHGRKVKFTGKVVFVSPLVSLAGDYVVFAEVNNRQENGLWVLSPGLNATMTIHLK
ncbi:MAG TPA: HlyD family efflux transporter periplasmic adaptor subunit [Pirellulales bacterium]|jgi:multidrug resistance efflux pump|nr:HlyD family efflux transporter periplasmic adaptor subunit [Pirellulales bacterium]